MTLLPYFLVLPIFKNSPGCVLLKSRFNFVVFDHFPQFCHATLVSLQLSDPSFHLEVPAGGDCGWCLPSLPPFTAE